MRGRAVGSTLIVVTLGSLLHFAWSWSGRSPIVAVFAATNESTWEHLKLAFWPALVLAPFQWRIYGHPPGWLPATAIRSLLPSVLIVALFYGYSAVVGGHYLGADIATFVVAVFGGELVGHALMPRRATAAARIAAAAALGLAILAFATLSFHPPSCLLFAEPD